MSDSEDDHIALPSVYDEMDPRLSARLSELETKERCEIDDGSRMELARLPVPDAIQVLSRIGRGMPFATGVKPEKADNYIKTAVSRLLGEDFRYNECTCAQLRLQLPYASVTESLTTSLSASSKQKAAQTAAAKLEKQKETAATVREMAASGAFGQLQVPAGKGKWGKGSALAAGKGKASGGITPSTGARWTPIGSLAAGGKSAAKGGGKLGGGGLNATPNGWLGGASKGKGKGKGKGVKGKASQAGSFGGGSGVSNDVAEIVSSLGMKPLTSLAMKKLEEVPLDKVQTLLEEALTSGRNPSAVIIASLSKGGAMGVLNGGKASSFGKGLASSKGKHKGGALAAAQGNKLMIAAPKMKGLSKGGKKGKKGAIGWQGLPKGKGKWYNPKPVVEDGGVISSDEEEQAAGADGCGEDDDLLKQIEAMEQETYNDETPWEGEGEGEAANGEDEQLGANGEGDAAGFEEEIEWVEEEGEEEEQMEADPIVDGTEGKEVPDLFSVFNGGGASEEVANGETDAQAEGTVETAEVADGGVGEAECAEGGVEELEYEEGGVGECEYAADGGVGECEYEGELAEGEEWEVEEGAIEMEDDPAAPDAAAASPAKRQRVA